MTARPALSPIKPSVKSIAMTLVISLVCVIVLINQLQAIQWADVSTLFGQISFSQWLGAAIATFGSFYALGHYDALWHGKLATGVPYKQAHRTGMSAVAIGQTLGLAAITASFVRWRRLSHLSAGQVISLTAAVSVSFMLCWAALLAPALWIVVAQSQFQAPPPWIMGSLLIIVGYAGLRLAATYQVPRKLALQLLSYTALDLVCAACVIAIFLPADVAFVQIFAAVIIAIGAGILSNSPGGIGAFDLTLIILLPDVAPEAMINALLAYRLIYILIPFIIAAIATTKTPLLYKKVPANAPPQWGISRQSGYIGGGKGWSALIGETACGSVAIGDTISRNRKLWTSRISAVYKCSERTASALRSDGWSVIRIAQEARINPQDFTTSGSKRQSLRRKLRKAAEDGITATERNIDPRTLASIAHEWAVAHGGELGFSMGRYEPSYLKSQRVFVILQREQAVGFVTFHQGNDQWELDLIRYRPSLPCGAMHTAIVAAIDVARREGATRLGLGAVPSFGGRFAAVGKTRAGLSQFKRSFGPTWHPVYHAARNPLWCLMTGLAVILEIQRPLQNLRYNKRVIKIMQAFHLNPSRARGIGDQVTTKGKPHDQLACTVDERPRLASG